MSLNVASGIVWFTVHNLIFPMHPWPGKYTLSHFNSQCRSQIIHTLCLCYFNLPVGSYILYDIHYCSSGIQVYTILFKSKYIIHYFYSVIHSLSPGIYILYHQVYTPSSSLTYLKRFHLMTKWRSLQVWTSLSSNVCCLH